MNEFEIELEKRFAELIADACQPLNQPTSSDKSFRNSCLLAAQAAIKAIREHTEQEKHVAN